MESGEQTREVVLRTDKGQKKHPEEGVKRGRSGRWKKRAEGGKTTAAAAETAAAAAACRSVTNCSANLR